MLPLCSSATRLNDSAGRQANNIIIIIRWGATVITNLLSAIPVFGQDIVESNNATKLSTCYFNEAFIFNETFLSVLPTVGTVSTFALKKRKQNKNRGRGKKRISFYSLSIIAFLAGFIDGDGYIQITRTTKGFIAIKLVITLSLEDLYTLEYILPFGCCNKIG